MYAQVEKPKENKRRAVSNSVKQSKSSAKQGLGFVDNRPGNKVTAQLADKPTAELSSTERTHPIQRCIYYNNKTEEVLSLKSDELIKYVKDTYGESMLKSLGVLDKVLGQKNQAHLFLAVELIHSLPNADVLYSMEGNWTLDKLRTHLLSPQGSSTSAAAKPQKKQPVLPEQTKTFHSSSFDLSGHVVVGGSPTPIARTWYAEESAASSSTKHSGKKQTKVVKGEQTTDPQASFVAALATFMQPNDKSKEAVCRFIIEAHESAVDVEKAVNNLPIPLRKLALECLLTLDPNEQPVSVLKRTKETGPAPALGSKQIHAGIMIFDDPKKDSKKFSGYMQKRGCTHSLSIIWDDRGIVARWNKPLGEGVIVELTCVIHGGPSGRDMIPDGKNDENPLINALTTIVGNLVPKMAPTLFVRFQMCNVLKQGAEVNGRFGSTSLVNHVLLSLESTKKVMGVATCPMGISEIDESTGHHMELPRCLGSTDTVDAHMLLISWVRHPDDKGDKRIGRLKVVRDSITKIVSNDVILSKKTIEKAEGIKTETEARKLMMILIEAEASNESGRLKSLKAFVG